jgi:DNA helicase-2/ATP-dependent DNA helicase PcrA
LEQNYRSTRNIISAAVSIITKNNKRVEKRLWTEQNDGDTITVYQAKDERNEAEFVTDEIRRWVQSGGNLKDIAVLYRTNYQSRSVEEALLQSGTPYKLIGGFRFYERKEIKDILSYLRVLNNPKDNLSLQRIINVPSRKIGPKSVETLLNISKKNNISMLNLLSQAYQFKKRGEIVNVSEEDISFIIKKYDRVVQIFGHLAEEKPQTNVLQLIDIVLRETRYIESFDDGSDRAESRKENITELKTVASKYVENYPDSSLEHFLGDIALIEQSQSKLSDDSDNAVTLMTLHTSKGLEYPVVFMIGLEEGLLPHSRSFVSEKELEEERRLCYVGVTRAKEKLFMTFAETRYTREGVSSRIPSRFLHELPREICNFYSWVG